MIKMTTQCATYEYATQEDRSARRVSVSVPAQLRAVGGKRLTTTTRNLSLSGFAAIAINRISPGTKCWLTLPGLPPREATVTWWEGGVIGCAFEQLLTDDELQALLKW